jgi:hypothetical protein
MSEEAVAKEDSDFSSPSFVGCERTAPQIGMIHYIIVDEGSQMDELYNHGKGNVGREDGACGAGGEEGDGGAETFAFNLPNEFKIAGNSRIKLLRLGEDKFFDSDKVVLQDGEF